MRGRKPKPTHLKLITGNPGKRPFNRFEPKPQGDLAEPPEWFTDEQKAGWRYAIEHAPSGLLKKLDASILAVWVVAESLHRDAAQKVATFGTVIKAPVTGVPIQSPYMAIVNRQALIMVKSAAELGFTPSSRTRITVAPGSAADDPASKYF